MWITKNTPTLSTDDSAHTRLRGRWLVIARVTWVALVSLTVVLFTLGLLVGLGQLRAVCMGGPCHPVQLSPAEAELHQQLGLSLDFYAWYTTIVYAIFGYVLFAVGVLIFWRRSDDWMALFVSLVLVMIGAGALPVITFFEMRSIAALLGFGSLLVVTFLFPDGRFVPRWMRWLVPMWLVYFVAYFLAKPLPSAGILGGPPPPLALVALLTGVGAQVYRYLRVSTPLQRQQTKWTMLGFAGWLVSLLVVVSATANFPALTRPGLPNLVFEKYALAVVVLLPELFVPVSLAISILRYRLWDVDIIVRRTLIYGVLTAALALVYFASVISMQDLFRAVTRQQSELAIIISTLAMAALFAPLRRRVQDGIDRRFYRRRYDASKVIAAFSATVRDEVDLSKLTDRLLQVVDETMQPAHVSLWLRKTEDDGRRTNV